MKIRIFALVIALYFPSSILAAQIGNFSQQCYAPNWITGSIEQVTEINVYKKAYEPVFGFTKRLPGGHWRIEYNIDRIIQYGLTNDVLVFLYYHECAHAKYNNESEAVADCAALEDMEDAGYLTNATYNNIERAYGVMGRSFPSGSCN